jgi:hypothetical protein
VAGEGTEKAKVLTRLTATADKTAPKALATLRSGEEVGKVSIKSSSARTRAVGRATQEQNIFTGISSTVCLYFIYLHACDLT